MTAICFVPARRLTATAKKVDDALGHAGKVKYGLQSDDIVPVRQDPIGSDVVEAAFPIGHFVVESLAGENVPCEVQIQAGTPVALDIAFYVHSIREEDRHDPTKKERQGGQQNPS